MSKWNKVPELQSKSLWYMSVRILPVVVLIKVLSAPWFVPFPLRDYTLQKALAIAAFGCVEGFVVVVLVKLCGKIWPFRKNALS